MAKIIQLRDTEGKIYPITKNEFICVGLGQKISNVYNEYYIIKFNKILNKNTDKLILENGIIKIGKNVKYIKIYFQCFCERNINFGYIWSYITLNNKMICDDLVQGSINYSSHKGNSFIISVKENDEINLTLNTTYPTRPVGVRAGNNTFLVVEII